MDVTDNYEYDQNKIVVELGEYSIVLLARDLYKAIDVATQIKYRAEV